MKIYSGFQQLSFLHSCHVTFHTNIQFSQQEAVNLYEKSCQYAVCYHIQDSDSLQLKARVGGSRGGR